jgi:hypothetical protein
LLAAIDSWIAAHGTEYGAVSAVAAKFEVDRSALSKRWKRVLQQRRSGNSILHRDACPPASDAETRGGHNKALTQEEEQAVYDRIRREVHDEHRPLVDSDIQRFATEQWAKRPCELRRLGPAWRASRKWVYLFKHRWKLGSKTPRAWKVGEDEDAAPADAGAAFAAECRAWLEIVGADMLINVDETAWRYATPGLSCIGFVGERCDIDLGADRRTCFTATLAATASGKKLRPAVLKEGKTELCIARLRAEYGTTAYLQFNESAWCTTVSFQDIISHVIRPHTRGQPAALVFDCASPHMSDIIDRVCEHHNIHPIRVPPGLTPTRQMLDISAFPVLKGRQRVLWRESRQEEDAEQIREADAVGALITAWNSLSVSAIQSGFRTALEIDFIPVGPSDPQTITLCYRGRIRKNRQYWLPWQSPPPAHHHRAAPAQPSPASSLPAASAPQNAVPPVSAPRAPRVSNTRHRSTSSKGEEKQASPV